MHHIDTTSAGSPLRFFLLVFGLSIPFWILGALVDIKGLPQNLPVSDLVLTFVPLVAASILVHRKQRSAGIRRLLKRAFDYQRITSKGWYVPVLLLMPFLYVLSYEAMRMAGKGFPAGLHIPFQSIPLLCLLYFLGAAGEELGYMGYAVDPMLARWGVLATSLMMGSFWAIWHYPSSLTRGDSFTWLAWGTLGTIGMRVLIVWIYHHAGRSVFAAIVFHVTANVGKTIFPGGIAGYDPMLGYGMIALTALIVLAVEAIRGAADSARPPAPPW